MTADETSKALISSSRDGTYAQMRVKRPLELS
jgi:hypothetical protein